MKQGVVLFAHGSRDPEWSRPFVKLSQEIGQRLPGVSVCLAYLESMKPSLEEAIAALALAGAQSIRIVPVFLGQGGHVKQDLPRLVEKVAKAHARLRLTLEPPIGEQPRVIEAIAAAISAGTPSNAGESSSGGKIRRR